MKSYIELDVWKEARKLVSEVYNITKGFPSEELYGIVSQMRRCVVSVPSNIAEGCGRRTAIDTMRFLFIARGSLFELETQLYLSLDQNYIINTELKALLVQIDICKKLLGGFINYYKKL